MVMSGIVYRGSRLDWYSGVFQCGSPDHVPFLDAGAGALHVLAGSAGRYGDRRRIVGSGGITSRCSGSTCMVGRGNDGGVIDDPSSSADSDGIGDGSSGGERLTPGDA